MWVSSDIQHLAVGKPLKRAADAGSAAERGAVVPELGSTLFVILFSSPLEGYAV